MRYFRRHERSLLKIGYAIALALLLNLWLMHGWLFGMLGVCLFVIVHLAFAIARALIQSSGWRDE